MTTHGQKQYLSHLPWEGFYNREALVTDWKPSSNHTIKFHYTTNEDADVFKWMVKDDQCILADGHYYDANELYVTVTKDENWQAADGNDGTIKEYKDKLGRAILKRTYGDNDVEFDTYYVYDDFGNLRFVIPPMASEGLKGASWSGITESNVFTADGDLSAGSPGLLLLLPWRYHHVAIGHLRHGL